MTLDPDRFVYGLATAADPQISPDGGAVAYVVHRNHSESPRRTAHLWLADADGGGHRQLTHAGTRNWSPRWSPDGGRIAFLSDRGEGHGTGIWILGREAGDPVEVARHPGPVGGLCWSPDGGRLAWTAVVDPANPDGSPPPADAPAPIRVTRRNDYKQDTDTRGWVGDARSQVWTLDLATGERRQLTSGPDDHVNPRWSPDGRRIAAQVPNRNHVASQLAILDAATGRRTATVGGERGVIEAWAWSPSGDRLAVAGEEARSWQLDWFIADSATGEMTRLTDDPGVAPVTDWSLYATPSQPVWIDDRHVLFHGVQAAKNGIWRLDVGNGSLTPVHVAPAQTGGLSVDRAGRRAAQAWTSHTQVGEIALVDLERGAATLLTSLNADVLRETPLAEVEAFTVERDGVAIDAWLLKPAGYDPGCRHPLVIDIHGGPNWWYGYDVSHVQQALAGAGFMVVYANPRGSTTYGREFTQAVTEDWGGEDYLDLMAVVDHVQRRPDVDPERAGVYGYSYGGFMSSWIIGHTDRFRAAVIGAPVVDLVSFYGTSDIGHVWGPQQFGGTPWERPEWYREHSPITYIDRATTPSLVLHGEADERCPIGQGEQLFTALREHGVETEFVRYPGMSHLFLWGGEPAYVADYVERTVAWFTRRV